MTTFVIPQLGTSHQLKLNHRSSTAAELVSMREAVHSVFSLTHCKWIVLILVKSVPQATDSLRGDTIMSWP